MKDSSLKVYGFTYSVGKKSFAFDIVADSAEEAQERAKAIGQASYCGQLIQANQSDLRSSGI